MDADSHGPQVKRKKTQRQSQLDFYFNKSPVVERRLLCKGSKHQGDYVNGGRQCVCIGLVFLAIPDIPKSTGDVDRILDFGTDLYEHVNIDGGYLMPTELPDTVDIDDVAYKIHILEPRSGTVNQEQDNEDSLTFCVTSAISQCLQESHTCFLTIGNSPGCTVGIKRIDGKFYVLDSHSRNDLGKCDPLGKAIVLQIDSMSQLVEYIQDMAQSICNSCHTPYEVTPVSLSIDNVVTGDIHPGHVENENTVISATDDHNETTENTTMATGEDLGENDIAANILENEISCSESGGEFGSSSIENSESRLVNECVRTGDDVDIGTDFAMSASQSQLSSVDIKNHISSNTSNELKLQLIENRQPEINFKFPAKLYKDKRKESGFMKRFCCRDWFKTFDFITYSCADDGLYCLACVLFPDSSHRRPKKMITEPYSNWKDALADLKLHAGSSYHLSSMCIMMAFKQTSSNPSHRIDFNMNDEAAARVLQNRQILFSIVKSIIFCGRQGIALRGHRDDDTEKCSSFNRGNFKELLRFRSDAGDEILQTHLASCAKNATYTSKTTQNDLLLCIKEFLQDAIVKEVKSQQFGHYYGIQCDEVTDASNWEQLGLILRYTVNDRPVERVLEFIACENITGVSLCNKIIESLTKAKLDTQLCRSQTMDGAGNMAGKYNGCAAKFTEHSPRALYHYCCSHDLNLVLCKSCELKEIHLMLDSLKQLGIFFKYSPKRTRRLEKAVNEINSGNPPEKQIGPSKFKLFCETRWVEKHCTLNVFNDMYEAIILCLEAIAISENNWDAKTVTDAYGLLKRIKDPMFIVCFQVVHHFFGYIRGLSIKLQGSTLDILQGYNMAEHVKMVLNDARTDDSEYDDVFSKATQMAEVADLESLQTPRRCGRQTQRSNVPADTPKIYFKRTVYIPFLDSIIQQFSMRFGSLAVQAMRAIKLIPAHLSGEANLNDTTFRNIFDFYKDDMPSPASFFQELNLWRRMWANVQNRPNSIIETLSNSNACTLMYPNITKVLYLMLLTSVTSSSAERANSSLKFIKSRLRSTMGEDRFNSLLLLYIHKDIEVNIDSIIDRFATKNPRKMLLMNPLSDE